MPAARSADPDLRSAHLFPSAEGSTPNGEERPVDLVHLARQTFGDKRLETELLRMFARQASQIQDRLETPDGTPGRQPDVDLLHSLVGSARVVGANRVAGIAERFETALRRGTAPAPSGLAENERTALRVAVQEACRFIGAILEVA